MRVAVIGAGLSGLAAAYRIRQRRPDARVVVLEASPRPGGNVGTDTVDGFLVERGPNGFLDNNPATLKLCRDLGLGERLIAASEGSRTNRYVFLNDRLQKLPGGLAAFVRSPLLSWRGKLAFARERFRRVPDPYPADESIHDFAARRAGREAAEVFADALVTGIHGGDPRLLSAPACFPRLVKFEREHGSLIKGVFAAAGERRRAAQARGEAPAPTRMWSFAGGLQVLIDRLVSELRDSIALGVDVTRIERPPDGSGWVLHAEGKDTSWRVDTVIDTTPAHRQAEHVAGLDADLAGLLREVPYNRIAVVALGYRAADAGRADLDGFGYIAPQRTRRDVLGVQWCSSIFPGRAPDGTVLWRALAGGWHRPDVLEWDDARLGAAVHAEIGVAMGVTGEPVFRHVVRWPRAIPQYQVGHLERVRRIRERLKGLPGLVLAGNAFGGVALNDCAAQAEALAENAAGPEAT